MEPVQAPENPGVAGDVADVHREVPVLHARPMAWRLRFGYSCVAAPVMAICADRLDGPWAAGFAYAVLLLGVGSTFHAMLPPRLRDRVQQPQESRAVVDDGHGDHREVPSPEAAMDWFGYALVAAPVMGSCFGLLDTPTAALVAYALLMLGVTSIWRAMLPPRPMERAQAPQEARAVVYDGHEVASPEAAMAWCGYVLVAAPVLGSFFGLADTPTAAILAYAIVLLGVAFIGLAMLPLRPMERFLREENHAVRNGNGQGDEVLVPPARGMDWTGYFFMAAPMLASCASIINGFAAILFSYALLLLGVALIFIAMLALAKPRMA